MGPVQRFARQHPWRVDGALAAVYLATMAGAYLAESLTGTPVPPGYWVLAVVFTGFVLLRRRLAVPGAIVVAVLVPVARYLHTGWARNGVDPDSLANTFPDGSPTITIPSYDLGALSLLLYAAAVYRPLRATWSAHVVATTAVIISILLYTDQWAWTVEIVAATAWLLVATVLGLQVRARRERVIELEDRARQLAHEQQQREQLAVAAERARIAREMHDILAHSLTVMIALAEGANAVLEHQPGPAREALEELASTGRTALADARRLVGVLRTHDDTDDVERTGPMDNDFLDPQPDAARITALLDQFRAAGLPVTLTESGPPLPDDPALELAVYRIIQECLTNVLRHAGDSPCVNVRLRRKAHEVDIEVENAPGGTRVTETGAGSGLIGIRERAAVFGGTVQAGPSRDGWRVRAVLRWPGPKEESAWQ